MLCLIYEPLGCAKTSGSYFLLALIVGLLPLVIYHMPWRIRLPSAKQLLQIIFQLQCSKRKKNGKTEKNLIGLELPNQIDRHKVSFYVKLPSF